MDLTLSAPDEVTRCRAEILTLMHERATIAPLYRQLRATAVSHFKQRGILQARESKNARSRSWGLRSAPTSERAISLGKELDRAINAYGVAYNRALCDRVLDVLPRAIRDLVYPHVFDRKECRVDHCHRHFTGITEPPIVTFFDTGAWKKQLEGHAIWSELAQSWYRTSIFVFDGCWGNEQMLHLMVHDMWNAGITPREVVQNIKVYLKPIHLFPDEHLEYEVEEMCPRNVAMLVQQLNFLLHIETPGVNIEIHAYSNHEELGEQNIPLLQQQLDLIFPVLRRMKEKNWKIRVTAWIDHDRWAFTPTTGDFSAVGWIDWLQQQRELRYGILPDEV